MKKLALLLISLVLIFGIISCNNDVNKPSKTELPSVELPPEFNPDKDSEEFVTEIKEVGDLANTITTLMNLFPRGQETPHEDVMKIASSLIGAAMEKGIALTLPNSNENTLSVEVKGSMSDDLVVTLDIVANVDYSFSDVSVKGNVAGILTIDTSKLKPSTPAQYSEESSSESPYKFELDDNSDLTIKVANTPYDITSFEVLTQIKGSLFNALSESYEQLLKDALTMIANFFK